MKVYFTAVRLFTSGGAVENRAVRQLRYKTFTTLGNFCWLTFWTPVASYRAPDIPRRIVCYGL